MEVPILLPRTTQCKFTLACFLLLSGFLPVPVVTGVPLSFDVDSAISNTQDLLSLIQYRYQHNTSRGATMFNMLENLSEDIWDIYKYKFAKKMVEGGQDFLMIFGGSSVTAGHDNMFEQSYPMVLRSRMEPLLAQVGVELKVRNIAMGANN